MELEIGEGDRFHLAIGGVVLDPVFVAAVAVARMQHRRVAVGDAGKLVEPAAGEAAEAGVVGGEGVPRLRGQVDGEQVLQRAVLGVEVLAGAVGGDGGGGRVGVIGDVHLLRFLLARGVCRMRWGTMPHAAAADTRGVAESK